MRTGPTSPALLLLLDDAEQAARCLKALAAAELPDGVVVLAGGAPAGRAVLEDLGGFLDAGWLQGDGAAVVNAAGAAVDGDLLLLAGPTEVGPGWLTVFEAVAAAEPDAATVTALSNDAGFLSVPRRNLPWPLPTGGLTPSQAAAKLHAGALGLHPRIPTALPHATLLRRAALQLAGPFDEALPLSGALADFCARCTAAGLAHVAADELFVAHRGPLPDGRADGWEGEVATRHPALGPSIAAAAEDRHSALARALLAASVALEPLTVTVDARNLQGGMNGSVVHVVELLGALQARDDVRVRALLPARVADDAGRVLDRVSGLERLSAEAATGDVARTHVAHRPWQVEAVADMALLDRLGERTVLTHQDLIGFRTPDAFASVREWQDYRTTTADALGLASMVLFFSEVAAHDAAAEDLVAGERSRVVPIGAVPQLLGGDRPAAAPPALAERARPFLLVLGNRFRHKNVRFALELLSALRADHGFDGDLVLAGGDVLHGSGSADDAAWLLRHPELAAAVVELGAVTEAEKAWLLEAAAAVVYPSTYEGFGLVPFEAAAAGTPGLVAWTSAMRETVPEPLALLVPWDARASAARAAPVLAEGAERNALVEGLRAAGAALSWERAADGLVAAYRDALRLPSPPAARLAADLARAEHDYWSVRAGIDEPFWTLVRPDAPQLDAELARSLSYALTHGKAERVRSFVRWAARLPGGG